MSGSERYDEEFEAESKNDSEEYADEGFEGSAEVPGKQQAKEKLNPLGNGAVRKPREYRMEPRRNEPLRKSSFPAELRSSAQSTGQLNSTSYLDSPKLAKKHLAQLRRENEDLRNRLKELNERLNAIIDQRISESEGYAGPRRKDAGEIALNTQLETAKKQVSMLKKEKSALATRVSQVSDPDFIESLQSAIEKKEKLLKKLIKSQKHNKKSQQTRESHIEKEISRSERSANTRYLQELFMENEGLRLKIKEAEQEDERIYAVSTELQDEQDRLEERYAKLMAIAREKGTFESKSRSHKQLKKVKQHYEEQKTTLNATLVLAEASTKALRRQESELRSELDHQRETHRQILEKLKEKQSTLSTQLQELKDLEPKVAGTGFEGLLSRITANVREQEAEKDHIALEEPLPRTRRRSHNGLAESESAPKPPQLQPTMSLPAKDFAKTVVHSPQVLPAATKPSLFAFAPQQAEEKPPIKEEKPVEIETSPKPAEVYKKPNLLKPSLFAPIEKLEETKSEEKAPDVVPTREVVSPSLKTLKSEPLLAQPKPELPVLPTKTDFSVPEVPPIPSMPSPRAEEIALLDAFPSRRRVQKPSVEPTFDSVLPKPRNRDHLLAEATDPPSFDAKTVSPIAILEVPLSEVVSKPRNRSHLLEPQDFSKPAKDDNPMWGKQTLDERDEKTKDLARKAEFGGIFGLEESLDLSDLDKAAAPVFLPAARKPEIPKVEIRDLEESDLML